ncbi:MAG: S24 family peptidase [Patescibacteria group bacterium]|jgi:SOS-response transcriptional repressor LexA
MLHKNQVKILELAKSINLAELTLQEIASHAKIEKASKQLIAFHIDKLKKKGFLTPDGKVIDQDSKLIAIPFFGAANAGPATLLADDQIQGYIKVSKSMLGKHNNIFSIKVTGNSMNKEKIEGKEIKDGSYLVVEKLSNPKPNDVVVTVVEGLVNIKKYRKIDDSTIALISNSSEEYPPIFLTQKDNPYIVGKVIQVLGNADMT